jgi:hypothetical protein
MKIGDDKVEGMTRCGKYVSKGWLWVTGKLTKKQFAKPRCPRCFS